jgi:hypothetical protein
MAECLASLSTELRAATLTPGEHSVHGLSVSHEDLIYSWDDQFKQHAGISDDSVAVLRGLQDDTDPSPLLLVFTDEDCPNVERSGFYRKVLIDQVVARLVCDLNLLPHEKTYTTTAHDLLRRTTDRIVDYMGRERQTSMIRIVRQNVFNRVADSWRGKPFSPVKLEADVLGITFKDQGIKGEFMDWLEDSKRTTFTDHLPPNETPILPPWPEAVGGAGS